jgi:hypothetical protein
MPRNVADRLGNLPLATQRFLVGPFAAARKPPAESAVHARLNDDGNELSETYWAYLFNSDWMAFAQARRYLPSLGGARAPYAKMVAALEPAQWAISAWVAPVAKAGHALVPT